MGGQGSKKKPPEVKKKKRKKKEAEIHEYLPKPRHEILLEEQTKELEATLMQLQRIPDPLDGQANAHAHTGHKDNIQTLPAWQKKWETELRPSTSGSAADDILTPRKATTAVSTATNCLVERANHPSETSYPVNDKLKFPLPDLRARYYGGPFSFRDMPQTPANLLEVEPCDIRSVSSMQVDGYRWLYKTDRRAANYWNYGAKIWQLEPKRANVPWFLGQDSTKVNLIDESRPKKSKPFGMIFKKRSKINPAEDDFLE